ncbi:uncharacterized protein [Clytia hemisphaerica]|uniref:uncharacterized protein n=1 Tax=Clytia hemisphaerica TaxID=252671 RepID=UPI0034D469EF
MADQAKDVQQADNVYNFLVNNVDVNIDIFLENTVKDGIIIPWSKSLEHLPLFTIKEIEIYRLKSGKNGKSIIKTRDRGRKFFEEKYITSGDTYTRTSKNTITFKGKCKASMKSSTFRAMNVVIDLKTSKVIKGHCNCPAGKSGYCNHVMALLFQIADYSLHSTQNIPEEVSCTSKKRQWGVPTDELKYPLPVMFTKILGDKRRGISSTLYDPRLNQNKLPMLQENKMKTLQKNLSKKDNRIGFAHVIDMMSALSMQKKETKYGEFFVGSTLSHQLAIFDTDFQILSSYPSETSSIQQNPDVNVDLPLSVIPETSECFPKDWGKLSYSEMMTLESIFPETLESARELERKTIGQDKNEFWMLERSKRITSSNAHKINIRKRNFETLAFAIQSKTKNKLPKFVEKTLQHGKDYENVAKEKFFDYLTFSLKKKVAIRECGLVVQPFLFWLGASPDGLLFHDGKVSLIEIKCPYTKRHWYPSQLVNDPKFYVGKENGVTFLKKNHQFGYFSQVQLAMGLSQIDECWFIVYTFKGLIITRVEFDQDYFKNMVVKEIYFTLDYSLFF